MKFLWSVFTKGLGVVVQFLMMKAAATPQKWDDEVLKWAEVIGKKFLPTHTAVWDESLKQWINLDDKSIGSLVRSVGAVTWKDMWLNKEFAAKSGLNELQIQNILVLGMSYLKPDAVDTQEEIDALADKVRAALK